MSPLRMMQRLFVSVTVGLALLGVVIASRLDSFAVPSSPLFYASVALSAASIPGVVMAGRLTPLPRGLSGPDAQGTAAAAYRAARLRQMVAAELPALLALVCSFVAHSAVPYLISGTVAVMLMAAFVIPTRARVATAQRLLDRDGATSQLARVLS